MKPHPILGAALTLGALVVPAQVPARALPALAPPGVATVVPTALTLTAPDALAGLDFGVAAGYRREVFLAPRGWVRYGPGWPGLYATRWGGPFVYHPYRRWRSEAVMFEPRRPASPDRKSTRLNSSHTVSSYAVFFVTKEKRTAWLATEYQV